jgi:NADPH:quinone reductase-like Zn-dependent oxidoreductase
MRAVAVDQLKGEPRIVELPAPTPKAEQLLIRVTLAGMNPYDWKLADGVLAGVMPNVLPFVLGIDAAGVVAAVGANVSRFSKGDRVFGQFLHVPLGEGTYAEYTVVPEAGAVAVLPTSISEEVGAALPTAGMTALALVDSLGLPTGSTVLITGATGGVGSFATQLASAKGYSVLVTAGAKDAARMRSLGAAQVYEYRATDLVAAVQQGHPQGIDAVIDLVSDAASLKRIAGLVRRGGHVYSTIGAADSGALKELGLLGGNFFLKADASLLKRLAGFVESDELEVPIEARIALEDVPAAIAAGRRGGARGKTVIRIA